MLSRSSLAALAAIACGATALGFGAWRWRSDRLARAADAAVGNPAPERSADDGVPALAAKSLSAGLPVRGQWRGKPAIADVNGDGNADLVASIRRLDHDRPGDGLNVWLGDGRGGWKLDVGGIRRDMGYGGVEVGDVDKDGRVDIAFSGHDVTPRVFLGNGSGFTETARGLDLTAMCADVALGDVDGDGNPDLFALGFWPSEGGLWFFRGDGTGGFDRRDELIGRRHFGSQIDVADLDGHGAMAVVAALDTGPTLFRFERSEAKFERVELAAAPSDTGGTDLAARAIDLDGDGKKEIVVAGMAYPGHPPLRAFCESDGKWREVTAGFPADEAFFDVEAAELDGAPPREIVAAGKRGIQVFAVLPGPTFRRIGRVENTLGVFDIAAGDVDHDGIDEILSVGSCGVRVLKIAIALAGGAG